MWLPNTNASYTAGAKDQSITITFVDNKKVDELFADINRDGVVTASDVNLAKSLLGFEGVTSADVASPQVEETLEDGRKIISGGERLPDGKVTQEDVDYVQRVYTGSTTRVVPSRR